MTLFTVYDAKGEPFEVRPDFAKTLVISHGWSLSPPKVVVVDLPEVHEVHAADAPVAEVAKDAKAG